VKPERPAHPDNVILYIGDGMGAAQRWLAETVYGETLAMNQLPVVGMFTNTPLKYGVAGGEKQPSTPITDSAASGTALATGHKTVNGVVGLGAERKVAYENLAEAAKRLGKSVGLISTALITDATPAAFGAHVSNRFMSRAVASQYLDQGFEVLMGGGHRSFAPESTAGIKGGSGADLIQAFSEKGYTLARTRQELAAIDIHRDTKILGLFAEGKMPYDMDRTGKEPDLAQMVEAAISVLKQNPKGFFLMVEGALIDYAGHSNDTGATVADVLELDRAVKTGVNYLRDEAPDTLILVCADHETGGLSLGSLTKSMALYRIKEIKHSTEWLGYRLLAEPGKVAHLFSKHMGISDLTPEEIARIDGFIALANKGAPESAPAKPSKGAYGKVSKGDLKRAYAKGSKLGPKHAYKKGPKKGSGKAGEKGTRKLYGKGLGKGGAFSSTIADIINRRIGIAWATFSHTAMPVMISAAGPGAIEFTGYYDQTEVAKRIARLWSVALRSWPVETMWATPGN